MSRDHSTSPHAARYRSPSTSSSSANRAGSEDCMSYRPPRPVCKLIETDENVFSIIGSVRDALRKAGQEGRTREFVERAFQAGSYEGRSAALPRVREGAVRGGQRVGALPRRGFEF